MARFLTAFDGSRGKPLLDEKTFRSMIELPPKPLRPRENGTHMGLGWDKVVLTDKSFGYAKGGNWFGMRSFMQRTPNGVCCAILVNASLHPDATDEKAVGDALQEMLKHVEEIREFGKGTDLFSDYP
jgi:hypothetical protein